MEFSGGREPSRAGRGGSPPECLVVIASPAELGAAGHHQNASWGSRAQQSWARRVTTRMPRGDREPSRAERADHHRLSGRRELSSTRPRLPHLWARWRYRARCVVATLPRRATDRLGRRPIARHDIDRLRFGGFHGRQDAAGHNDHVNRCLQRTEQRSKPAVRDGCPAQQ